MTKESTTIEPSTAVAAPVDELVRPSCKVNGCPGKGRMCGYVVVIDKTCSFKGVCEHKQTLKERIILVLKNNGASATWMISAKLKEETSKIRYQLKKLETSGEVVRSKRYGSVNNIVWLLPA